MSPAPAAPPAATPRTRRRLTDVSVNVKILAAVGLATVVALAVGGLGLTALAESSAQTRSMYDKSLTGVRDAAAMDAALLAMDLAVSDQALTQSPAEKSAAATRATEHEQVLRDDAATYLALDPEPEEVASIETVLTELDAFVAVRDDQLVPLGERGAYEEWVQVRDEEAQPHVDAMIAAIEDVVANEASDAEAAAAEAAATYRTDLVASVALLVLGLGVALTLGFVVARSIVTSLRQVRRVCDALAANDLTVSSGVTSRDEVGQMGAALDVAVASLRDVVQTIESSATSVAGSAEELSANTQHIAAGAEETSAQAGVVSAAADQVSRNVQTVAAGTEQMGASIREIAQNATEAARVAQNAVSAAETSTATVQRLGDSSREIGNVVKAITSIAEQTNLLALNATIEAARAGDAGKGFAVVAGEVKELARETASATEDIARRIEAIQLDTTSAVEAITGISEIIASISGYQQTIASAVEEQTATTSEMARSVAEAATGSGEIAANIAGVAGAADMTTSSVTESRQGVADLARMSGDLSMLVSRFRV